MGLIPIVMKPYPDELFYSWVCRLAKLNGLSLHRFVNTYISGNNYKNQKSVPVEIRCGFMNFYKSLNIDVDVASLYLSTSTFGYECLGLKEPMQTRAINNVFYPIDKLNTLVNPFFNTLNICPKCVQEDIEKYGTLYYHRAHQLSGIYRCYKHKIPLCTCNEDLSALNESMLDYREVEIDDDSDYSQFGLDLLDANLDIDADRIAEVCKKREVEVPKVKMYGNTTATFLPALYVLCDGSVEALKNIFNCDNSASVIRKYRCGTCDTDYFGSSFGHGIGYRCEKCEKTQNVQNRLINMVSLSGNGEYNLCSDFKSMDKKVMIKHTCGLTYKVSPRDFLFERKRCECQRTVSEKEAKEKVESSGDYKLIEFTKGSEPITVQSVTCGHIFKTGYYKFTESPGCRICHPAMMDNEAFEYRVKTVANGEFGFVGNYQGYSIKTDFIHHTCNMRFKATPKYFLENKVCPYCDSCFENQWNTFYIILCQYKKEFKTADVPKRLKYNNIPLGLWCQRQRNAFKENRLSEIRVQKLLDIGFIFDPLEEEWNRKLNQYKRYIQKYQTTEITKRFTFENENLGVWIQTQKTRYKQGKLSDNRINKLKSLNEEIFN